MYPLTENYKEPIKDFLRRLNRFPEVEVITNGVSTQVFGEYDEVMRAYTESLKDSMALETTVAVVTKMVNSHLPPDRWDSRKWTS